LARLTCFLRGRGRKGGGEKKSNHHLTTERSITRAAPVYAPLSESSTEMTIVFFNRHEALPPNVSSFLFI